MTDRLKVLAPYALALLRIVAALLFIEHGIQKLLGFPAAQFSPHVGSLIWFAGIIEVVGGLAVLLGWFARPAAFLMSGEMAVAYWTAHAPHGPFPVANGGESAILFCFIFLYIACAGPGAWSLAGRGRARRYAL